MYNAAGELIASVEPTGLIYTHFSGARSQEYAPDGTWAQRFYDAAGRQKATLDHLSLRTTLTLDAADRVSTFQSNVLLWQRQQGSAPALTQVYAQDGTSANELVRAIGSNGSAALNRQFHTDAQGSVEALTTGSQSVEADYTLDAFGNVLAGSASNNPLVFGGGLGYWQEMDLGLEYVRARWLNSQNGTWLSVDPVLTEPRYSYVRNNPVLSVDPNGLQQLPPRTTKHIPPRPCMSRIFDSMMRSHKVRPLKNVKQNANDKQQTNGKGRQE